MTHVAPLNPNLAMYKIKVRKSAKCLLEICALSLMSFLVCDSKYTKLNMQKIHLRISSHKSEESIYFASNKN